MEERIEKSFIMIPKIAFYRVQPLITGGAFKVLPYITNIYS